MIQKKEPTMEAMVAQAAGQAAKVLPRSPRWAVVPGTGPAELLSRLEDMARIDPEELAPGWLETPLLWGTWRDRLILVVDTPPSPWEKGSDRTTLFLYRFLAALGVEKVVITTACASLHPRQLPAGRVGIVTDHLDFSGSNPLRTWQGDAPNWPLFPDLTRAYEPSLLAAARNLPPELAPPEVVLVAVPGPSLPTPMEYSFYRNSGGQVAAMRGPQEVVAAVQAGLQPVMLVASTQEVDPVDPAPADLEGMMEAAERAAPCLVEILLHLIEEDA